MIDLHSHILPGLDDGSQDLETSIEMARIAVDDGTNIMACTPHITPGVYENSADQIIRATLQFQDELDRLNIPLHLTSGADYHISNTMLKRLRNGSAPTIGATNYFLFEPSHHVLPPNLVEFCQLILQSNYIPILTHPERLTWIEKYYGVIRKLSDIGVLIQITANSVTGQFGKRSQYWCEKLLEENRVDLVASDAHNNSSRSPGMSKAAEAIAQRMGRDISTQLVTSNPVKILRNEPIKSLENKDLDNTKPNSPAISGNISKNLTL